MKPEEWIGFAPSHIGKIRANHSADYCEGGSKSMIVERKDNGDLHAHCFRCLHWGFVPADGVYRHRVAAARRAAGTAMEEVIKLAEQALPAMGRDIRYLHFGLMEARSELDLPQRWDGDGQHSIH
jgi:hypothetical protein